MVRPCNGGAGTKAIKAWRLTASDRKPPDGASSRTVTVVFHPLRAIPWPTSVNGAKQRLPPPLTVNAPGVLGNDSDPDGDSLTVVLVGNPSNGLLTLNPDGSLVYVPAVDFSGTDSFTYEANDGQLNSNIATVMIEVSQGSDNDMIFANGFD